MKQYFLVAKNTWDETITYRLNVIIWRIRMVLGFLTTYFLWFTIIPQNKVVFGYSQSSMLTYILGATFLAAFIFSSRSGAMGDEIINGTLSNYLIRPINYFLYWFSRDLGDKAMNVLFAAIEFTLICLILRPPLFIQTNIIFVVLTLLAVAIAITLYFFVNVLIAMGGFWVDETWSLRFLLFVILQFFAGMLFPIDILPKPIALIFQLLPFQYLIYFPLKLYLGQLSAQQILIGFFISGLWVFLLYKLIHVFWKNGLKNYSAVGR